MPLPTEPSASHRKANEIAYQQLRTWIVDGPLEPGEPLKDTEIAQLIGVGRTPVREALIRLAHEGLVAVTPGKRTCVAALDFDRADEYYSIGAELDAYAARVAATKITDTQIDALENVLEQMRATRDTALLEELDRRFHRIYYDVVASQLLDEFTARIESETKRIERTAFGNASIRGAAYDEHARIVVALRERDPDTAARLARENWLNSWRRIEQVIAPNLNGGGASEAS